MRLNLPKHANLWLPGVLAHRSRVLKRGSVDGPIDVLFCLVDHFEPGHGARDAATRLARVEAWRHRYVTLAQRFTDADGRHPQHSFFFPEEEYSPALVEPLAALCREGYGTVEVHLHHDHDTAAHLRERLDRFVNLLHNDHGLLRRDRAGRITFGFVHGNWALDNARPDGRWCGVNDELTILRQLGCYGDFTLPAAPDPSQTRTVNQIYYAIDDPSRPRSHDYGIPAAVGRQAPVDGLLIIQGPLGFDWSRRVYQLLPGLENSAIDNSDAHLPTLTRFRSWVETAITVEGRPNWIFVKAHTHGATEENAAVLLGPCMEAFHREVGREFNDGIRYRLHYVNAFEMATLVRAAELGHAGNPGDVLKQVGGLL